MGRAEAMATGTWQFNRRAAASRYGAQPASRSMFESSLYHGDQYKLPEIKGVDCIQKALEDDARKQTMKYGSLEASSGMARFTVALPASPQHKKFCRQAPPEKAPSTEEDSSATPRAYPSMKGRADRKTLNDGTVRFNKQTLTQLFRQIDRAGSGFVSRRQTWIVLQEYNYLQNEQETSRIKAIMLERDTDGSASMNWNQFLDFFSRAGLLLRYDQEEEVEAALERTEFWSDLNVLQLQLKHDSTVDQPPESIATEIRSRIGVTEEARFRKNRRAVSLECEEAREMEPHAPLSGSSARQGFERQRRVSQGAGGGAGEDRRRPSLSPADVDRGDLSPILMLDDACVGNRCAPGSLIQLESIDSDCPRDAWASPNECPVLRITPSPSGSITQRGGTPEAVKDTGPVAASDWMVEVEVASSNILSPCGTPDCSSFRRKRHNGSPLLAQTPSPTKSNRCDSEFGGQSTRASATSEVTSRSAASSKCS